MKVVDIMTPNPWCVTPDQPLFAAATLMRDHDVGMIPVIDDLGSRHPVGVITDRDIAVRHVAAAHHHDCPCRDAMTTGPLVTVQPTDDVNEVVRRMGQAGVRRVIVTEPQGRVVGVVATADLFRHADAIGEHSVAGALESISEPTMIER
jgi:CBS domain-containing protein